MSQVTFKFWQINDDETGDHMFHNNGNIQLCCVVDAVTPCLVS